MQQPKKTTNNSFVTAYTRTRTQKHTHTHARAFTYKHAHAHTHTHTQTCAVVDEHTRARLVRDSVSCGNV